MLGVPFGTFLGQNFGWRSTFWAITIIGVVALMGIALMVPRTTEGTATSSLRSELGAFTSGQVWLSIVVTILGFGGMFGAFTYIAFTLTEVSGFDPHAVPWLLVLFGAGLFVGNIAGGKAADKSIDKTLMVILAGLALVLVFFALTAASPAATLFSLALMGGFGFATVPGLQMRVMHFAATAPTLASGANIGAFNLGNALGAWLGGVTITMGLGYTSPIWAGAAITVAALLVMIAAAAAAGVGERRSPLPHRKQPPTSFANLRRHRSPRRTARKPATCFSRTAAGFPGFRGRRCCRVWPGSRRWSGTWDSTAGKSPRRPPPVRCPRRPDTALRSCRARASRLSWRASVRRAACLRIPGPLPRVCPSSW
ncbi:uncharacterized MFS-type transporter YtbD [Arthrobacter sp. Hiyo8]|nr:uncharacterized MFS-type transporter YtbD [Arthrobacter sp. Hiyo8]